MPGHSSNLPSSSLFEGDASDPIYSCFPSNWQLSTPEPSGSRDAVVLNSDFSQTPLSPPPIPHFLQRVGPNRDKAYVLYTHKYNEMERDAFVSWWLQTDYGMKKRINWDTRHQSACWKQFDQVADAKTGKPAVMCNQCIAVLDHPANCRHGTSSMNKHIKGVNCRKVARKPNIKQALDHAAKHAPKSAVFTQSDWEHKLTRLLAVSRLPFQFIEHPEFHDVIHFSRLAPTRPEIPSAKVMRARLRDFVKKQQQDILQQLPADAKLSLALDCWTSPFRQAFMAVTGYFLTYDWEYQEVLLGFEPLSGTHSGMNLSEVLMNLLQEHKVTDRVLAITTDNASSNNTLLAHTNDAIQSLGLHNSSTIIRVPCIAHVIQLSLKDLLGQMKASPKNEVPEMEWSDACIQSLRESQQEREIADTLNKIRSLAIYINASPQRREAFYNLQKEEPKLAPIQDVKTRWNSTFLMLRRAKRLQSIFDKFCKHYDQDHFALGAEEWRQVEYLLWITQPFFKFTSLLSQTRDVSIHLVFSIYNKLFDHLEKSTWHLQRKKVAWKQLMLAAIHAAKEKLAHYYSMTDEVPDDLYALGTIIAPQRKLHFFSGKDWDDPVTDWRGRYRTSLERYLEPYQRRVSDTQSPTTIQSSAMAISELEMICAPQSSQQSTTGPDDELSLYLDSGTVQTGPRVFWKEHQHRFPALATLARDVLSIPATGAGVERLFNSARDVCHYRRGSLSPRTIRDLMLFMCTSRFDIKEEQRAMIQDYLSDEEIQADKEEHDTQESEIDPISDNEEGDEGDPIQMQQTGQAPSEKSRGKQRRSNASRPEPDHENEDDELTLPLPDTQQRISVTGSVASRY